MRLEKDLISLRKIRQARGLSDEANPTEWQELSASRLKEELKKHRFLDCKYYKRCLDYASDLRWQGWSCHWCNLKVEEKKRRNPYETGKPDEKRIYKKLDKVLTKLSGLRDKE